MKPLPKESVENRKRATAPPDESADRPWLDALSVCAEKKLPGFLKSQRWFRGKGKTLLKVQVDDSCVYSSGQRCFLLLWLRVDYQEGGSETYFSPFVGIRSEDPEKIRKTYHSLTFEVTSGPEYFFFQEAFSDSRFKKWFLEHLEEGAALSSREGNLVFRPARMGFESRLLHASDIWNMDVEQSNTSVVIREDAVLKVFRKIEDGISPEVEMLAFLYKKGFAFVPGFRADIVYEKPGVCRGSAAVMQSFVKNGGDGWHYAIRVLRGFFERIFSRELSQRGFLENEERVSLAEPVARFERLGKLTAEMHAALASDKEDEEFRPEPVTPQDVAAWSERYHNLLKDAATVAQKRVKEITDGDLKEDLRVFLEAQDQLAGRADTLKALCRRPIQKIRCHGDYHLGQVLRGEKDWAIFDFEGEPLRSIEDRRKKTSALRDVAGMLRSFDYAVQVSAYEFSRERQGVKNQLNFLKTWWRNLMGGAFLKGYWESVLGQDALFLLPSQEENKDPLSFFELEKAIYELNYELNNRPQWVAFPLEGVKRFLGPVGPRRKRVKNKQNAENDRSE